MKFKLSFIALLLCTLFFACKKNEILDDETVKVSAGETVQTFTRTINPIVQIDIPSDMEFPLLCIPSDSPFFIFATVVQINQSEATVLFQFETNPNYLGTDMINSLNWSWTYYDFLQEFTGIYQHDNLEIPISRLSNTTMGFNATSINGNTYTCRFSIGIDQEGQPIITILQGDTVDCDAARFSITYTLVLP